jgi:glycosyltransferase involved in cell wall biosynthesis
MPTTASRRWCVPLAIRQFRRQSIHQGGSRAELVVVFDGPGSVLDLMPQDPRVRLVVIPSGDSLGNKFNACVEAARGDFIALWADDDWHHPERLSAAMGTRRGRDVALAGSQVALFHELIDPGDTYEYRSPDESLIGGTCLFERSLAQTYPFPDRPSGVDTMWLYALQEANVDVAVTRGPPYVAMQHGQTTGRKQWPPSCGDVWTKWTGDLKEIMGDDLSAYRRAYTRR